MEIDWGISDTDEGMPDLEDLYGDTLFDETEHRFVGQNHAAPPILRPATPIWQKSMENGLENPGMEDRNRSSAPKLAAVQMNIDQNHASLPTKPFVSVLNYEDELAALEAEGLKDLHRALELQQIQNLSPPPLTMPPEVTARDPQARIKQLKNLYFWQSNQMDILKRKTDEMEVYCENQYKEKMPLHKELNIVNARLSLFGAPVSTPFSEVLKEWEQSEFKDLTLDGIDLNHFLFNPKGAENIPQDVRRPVSKYNLFRLHFEFRDDPKVLSHQWRLAKFHNKDKYWHSNCQLIDKWQKDQEARGWIRPVNLKGDKDSSS